MRQAFACARNTLKHSRRVMRFILLSFICHTIWRRPHALRTLSHHRYEISCVAQHFAAPKDPLRLQADTHRQTQTHMHIRTGMRCASRVCDRQSHTLVSLLRAAAPSIQFVVSERIRRVRTIISLALQSHTTRSDEQLAVAATAYIVLLVSRTPLVAVVLLPRWFRLLHIVSSIFSRSKIVINSKHEPHLINVETK